ncbi:CDP-glycerol glycerophosphotransferase family protein [Alkalicoccus daliensis]|uniref:CDP-glycerol:poly(Glycerophosphate) glycerophosphotransferase n=1 Tax=Alkalicoccus daliensis TaxID=745820 RepID=A0A1G9ZL89_9BACI|nr:CDP-glycerol glycerophosphotransferase family protein [Alkalicoccus daliensis]SDN22070.1 CDP-glycerol:poly(glycerophosphate) glycerophosphotransferase [Alkalicoccus daliensis]
MNQVKINITKLLIAVFSLFPVKRNKLLFMSYDGGQYSCNPKYITNYILENHKEEFEIVWILNKTSNLPFKTVQAMSMHALFHFATAKVIISNQRLPGFFTKRKNQFYLQTWHSSLRLKQIEKDAGNTLDEGYIRRAVRDSSMCDLLLSGCQKSTEIMKNAFWYDGEIFEKGTPRNDVLLSTDYAEREKIKKKFDLKNKKIVLYAPTFRRNNNGFYPGININKTLNENFEGDWEVIIKLHPHVKEMVNNMQGKIMNDADDTQELLAITDILITDYSSLMFDFALTGKPIILFAPDLNDYLAKERKFYFNLEDLPFPIAQSAQELTETIVKWDAARYKENLNSFLSQVGSFENGRAAAEITDRIKQLCSEKEMNPLETI